MSTPEPAIDDLPPGTAFGLYFHADGVVGQGDALEPPPGQQAAPVADNNEGESQ